MNDVTMTALQSMLRGLSARQRAIADNIANVETPGFVAKRVEFEASLKRALDRGTGAAAPTTRTSSNPVMPNGNNVQIDEEVLDQQETAIRYQLAIEAMSSKFNVIRASMRSSI